MKSKYHWAFRVLGRAEMRHGSTEQEFFAQERLDSSPPEALARESIQNALDAGRGGPVRVTFTLQREEQSLQGSAAEPYLTNLRRHLEVQDDKVAVKMTLTAPGCGMGGMIASNAQQLIMSLPGVSEANVDLVWDPPWDPTMMSEEAKQRLGIV